MSTDFSTVYVCHECIGEDYLSNQIEESGDEHACSSCGDNLPAISVAELGDMIHQVIETYFARTSSEPEGYHYALAKEGLWERDGYPVLDVICDIANIDPKIGETVHEHLSEIHDAWGKDAFCEEQPYDSEAHYDERQVDTYDQYENWSSFKASIRSHSRFFNPHAKDVLEGLFSDIATMTTKDSDPVVRVMGSEGSEERIYRARIALTFDKTKEILINLPKSLGSPPHHAAKSGRMNAAGISVFYGALDSETCIAELRAPVGSSVVVGEFIPLRPIQVLDLNRLQDVIVRGSFFDPDHAPKLARAIFLERLVSELSAPVMPGSEEMDYLPTQFVAEYLSQINEPNLDGILFRSSQVSSDGNNIVLFHEASLLEPYELPAGSEVDAYTIGGDPDDYDPSITIFETVPPEDKDADTPKESRGFFEFDPYLGGEEVVTEYRDPTLRLDMESVKVHEIHGVTYSAHEIDVSRSRVTKKDLAEF